MPLICPADQTENPDGSLRCSRCQRMLSLLTPGTPVEWDSTLEIQAKLREDSHSLSFLAKDKKEWRGGRYVIREFFPPFLEFDQKQKFNTAADELKSSGIRSLGISYWSTIGNRGYTVSKSLEGRSLLAQLNEYGRMQPDAVRKWFRAILAVLKDMHGKSLYHGNLTPDRVVLQDGDVCLLDSLFLADCLQRGGIFDREAPARKDLRDAGRLALEMLDPGLGATAGYDPVARAANIDDLVLGATLDFLFSTVSSASACQIDELFALLETAERDPSNAKAIWTGIHERYRLERIAPLVESGNPPQQAAENEAAVPSPTGNTDPSPNPPAHADPAVLPERRDFTVMPILVLVFGFALLILIIWRTTSSDPPSKFRAGIYNWPSLATYYAARAVGGVVEVESNLEDLFGTNSKGAHRYDVISLPLTAISDHRDGLENWRLVWASEYSKGAEKILAKNNAFTIGKDGGLQLDEAEVRRGDIVTIRSTFAANLLRQYLSEEQYARLKDRAALDEVETASELLARVENSVLIVVHDPLAAHIMSHWPFMDITSPKVATAQYVNVLLLSPEASQDKKVPDWLIDFIAKLERGRKDAERYIVRDALKVAELKFFDGTVLEKKGVQLTLERSVLVGAADNVQFLHNFGGFGCSTVARTVAPSAEPGPCVMLDRETTRQVLRGVQSRPGYEKAKLSHENLASICSLSEHGLLDGVDDAEFIFPFDPGSDALTGDMRGQVAKLKLDLNSHYCVIGRGDDTGSDFDNLAVGARRAAATAGELQKVLRMAEGKIVRVSLGKKDSKPGKEFRRVEIRRLRLVVDGTD